MFHQLINLHYLFSAQWTQVLPRCSTECAPLGGSHKLEYEVGRTYTYQYSGTSLVRLEGVQDEASETTWSKKVELTFLSPCDVVLSIRDSQVEDTQGQSFSALNLPVKVIHSALLLCPYMLTYSTNRAERELRYDSDQV